MSLDRKLVIDKCVCSAMEEERRRKFLVKPGSRVNAVIVTVRNQRRYRGPLLHLHNIPRRPWGLDVWLSVNKHRTRADGLGAFEYLLKVGVRLVWDLSETWKGLMVLEVSQVLDSVEVGYGLGRIR